MLPKTEEAFVRHYSLSGEDVEIIGRYRTPETRLAFALQHCVLRYPGRVLRQGEVMPFHLLAFIADQVRVSPDAIAGFARRQQTRYEHLAFLRSRFRFSDLTDATKAELKQWLAPIALKTTDEYAVLVALTEELRRRGGIITGVSVIERLAAEAMHAAEKTAVRLICERVTTEQRTCMDETKQRLARAADVLDAILKAHDRNESIDAAIAAVTTWDTLSADARLIRRSPLGWDLNLTGDYVWSDSPAYDADGLRPLNHDAEMLAA